MPKVYQLDLSNTKARDDETIATLFSQGNGNFGVRATDPLKHQAGTIINGFYVKTPIIYGEAAVGYAKYHQTIVSLPSLRDIEIRNDQGEAAETIALKTANLDMQTGACQMLYQLRFPSSSGTLQLRLDTIVGQTKEDLSAFEIRYQLTSEDYSGTVVMRKQPLEIIAGETDIESDPRMVMRALAVKVTTLKRDEQSLLQVVEASEGAAHKYVQIQSKTQLSQTKALHPGESLKAIYSVQIADTAEFAPITPGLAERTQQYWQQFWKNAAVEIQGDDQLSSGLHFNLFQLTQSANRTGQYSIAAKGVSGPGYEGHFFWDTEMYMLPFFTFTQPKIARRLLEFRYHQLPKARVRARELGVKAGALFAWRSINGEEASAFFPAGTAQYHLDADIAYAVVQYYEVTQDQEFMLNYGLPILKETAEFWLNFGAWNQNSQFMLHDVTGPDEYTAIVDNNYYTNKMAQANMSNFLRYYHLFRDKTSMTISTETLSAIQHAAEQMYLPQPVNGVTPQDDTFLNKPIWPFETTEKHQYPLLLHFHPLTIYRYQVNKQPDELMTDLLFPDAKSMAQKQQDYQYYLKLATHDSSLSKSAYAILAANIGHDEEAFEFFMDSALLDLNDLQGNTKDGLHMANLGGSWMSMAYGFAGLQAQQDHLAVTNRLPQKWQRLRFAIQYRGRSLMIDLRHGTTKVEVTSGPTLNVIIDGVAKQVAGKEA
ncbi:glycoside hydrolase family 65 protein [Lacticaseibacillus porcinae]|uniref:glycoside hydrolase family 65 protein n=1 Tax=Lacticaseibacillus porcinae TaxID=1123687 RepID=UPI000F796FF6|nr:glycosyl hydrolase family 65 protein [Lacticaseibacillus porcinae]